jgi:hypothetical protein
MRSFRAAVATVLLLPLAAAAPGGQPQVTPLDLAAADGSGMYSLETGANGRNYLAWIEPLPEGGHALKFSRLDGDRWQPPREIARGSNWFVNWADRPSVTSLLDGTLMAHWLVHTGRKSGSYGYGIRIARSTDSGATWQTAFEDGMENVSDYAGFVSFGSDAGGARAVYLSPVKPDTGGAGHEGSGPEPVKTLAAVAFDSSGTPIARQVIDGDVCSCCPTDMALTDEGLVAVYRDHLPGDIRDISIVRLEGRGWSGPSRVHEDGWKIGGCPTNGPVVAARGRTVAVAWFTAANDTPRVKLAFSGDGGRTFATPITVDDGRPVGWPGIALLDDGGAAVSWLERRADGKGAVMIRRVPAAGQPSAAVAVAETGSGRSTGVPQLARDGNRLVVAWRNERVLTAVVPIDGLR